MTSDATHYHQNPTEQYCVLCYFSHAYTYTYTFCCLNHTAHTVLRHVG